MHLVSGLVKNECAWVKGEFDSMQWRMNVKGDRMIMREFCRDMGRMWRWRIAVFCGQIKRNSP